MEEEERRATYAWASNRDSQYWGRRRHHFVQDEGALAFEEIVDRNGSWAASHVFQDRWYATDDTDDEFQCSEQEPPPPPQEHSQNEQGEQDKSGQMFGEEMCRVCRCESTPEQPLYYPCLCKGSIRYIHEDCLVEWLKRSNKTSCELCKTPFRFQSVYADNAPRRLASHQLLFGIMKKGFHFAQNAMGLLFVFIAWFVVVPVCTSWIWRFYFDNNFQPSLSHDITWGWFLSVAIILTAIGITWLLEYIQTLPGDVAINWDVQEHHVLDVHAQHEELHAANEDVQAEEIGGDEFAEDLDFELIVGLRGSWKNLIFNVMVVLIINAAILAVLALIPYHVGHTAINASDYVFHTAEVEHAEVEIDAAVTKPLDDFKAVAVGYAVIIAASLTMLGPIMLLDPTLARAQPITKWMASMIKLALLCLKVIVLLFIELGIFPEISGWLIDIASLPLFGSTLDSRISFFRNHSYFCLMLHWSVGLLFMYCFCSSLQWLRSVLRPGIFWFFRTDDPHFDIIQELIQVSLVRQARRIMLIILLFSTMINLLIGLPIRAASMIPSLLPLNLMNHDTLYSTSTEIVLFHFIVPFVLKYAHPLGTLKRFFLWWLMVVAPRLELMSYLFERDPLQVRMPSMFPIKIIALLLTSYELLFFINLLLLSAPLIVGRLCFSVIGLLLLSDVYAYIFGWILIWATYKGVVHAFEPITNQNLRETLHKTVSLLRNVAKLMFMGFFMFISPPLMIGTLLEVTIGTPILVPWLDQCPAPVPLLHNWAVGFLFFKLWHKSLHLLGDDSEWKQRMQRITEEGYTNIDLVRTWNEVILPINMTLAIALFAPYFVALRVIPLLTGTFWICAFSERFCHLIVALMIAMFKAFAIFHEALTKLHDSIRDELFLVGRHLQNYEQR